MAILTFCSALAVIIYLNIQKSTLPFFKIKAVELAEFYMKKAMNEKGFDDRIFQAEEFTVKRSATISKEYPDCYEIRMIVFDCSKKKVHEIEQLIFNAK